MKKTLEYEIENVGGVAHAAFSLQPGVNVLSGRNAAGKTSAMDAIVRAQGGKAPLERRDGAELGMVSGPGVTLRVGMVVRSSGEAELELADTGPLARLIDPGLKDTEAAARERVRALIELLDLAVDDEALLVLCRDDDMLHKWLSQVVRDEAVDDLMDAAEMLRHHAHTLAREGEEGASAAEARRDAAAARGTRLLEELGGLSALVGDSPDDVKKALDGAIRKHERALAQCEARQELEAKQRSIRATIGEKPAIDLAARHVSSLESMYDEAGLSYRRAQHEAEKAAREYDGREIRLIAARKDLDETKQSAARWDEQDAILREPVTGLTPDEVAELQSTLVEPAISHAAAAHKSADYRDEQATKATAEQEQEAAEKSARHYRKLAAGIPERLGEILRQAGAPSLTVVDGRLHALMNGFEHKDFEHRCSTGERVALALDVAATAYKGKVLPLDGTFWASLDPEHQAAFAKLAHERGLFVITENPTDGELRVETMTGGTNVRTD